MTRRIPRPWVPGGQNSNSASATSGLLYDLRGRSLIEIRFGQYALELDLIGIEPRRVTSVFHLSDVACEGRYWGRRAKALSIVGKRLCLRRNLQSY